MASKAVVLMAVCATAVVAIPALPPQLGPVTGAPAVIDPSSREVQNVASFAVRTITNARNSGPLRLVRIISAESTLATGTNYRMTIELSGSSGLETCNVSVSYQPSTQTRKLNSFSCSKAQSPTNATSDEQTTTNTTVTTREDEETSKAARSATSSTIMPPEATTSPGNATTLETKLETENESTATVGRVNQTVPTSTQLKIGSVTTAPTMSTVSPTAANLVPEPLPNRPALPVGFSPMNPNDPIVQDMTNFAVQALSSGPQSVPLTLLRVLSAASQVGTGINYRIVVEVKSSDRVQTCTLIVYDQPWTSTRQLISSECL